MPIKITTARDASTIDDVLKLRHKVFSEEESFFSSTPDKRVIDRFDAFPSNHNLVVICDDHVIGSLRFTFDSDMGVPADEYFDFRSHLPEGATVAGCGMYCVTKPYRNAKMALSLILMASYLGISQGVSHVIAPVNPQIARMLKRVGFQALGDEMTDAHLGLRIVPMMLDVKNLTDFFFTFAQNNKLYNFLSSYECIIYQAGEYIVRTGEVGETAYVIIEGEVEVRGEEAKLLATMGQGEVFGELALLTDAVRAADVIAKTDLRVMSLSKSIFMEHLLSHPERALGMLKSMGSRMRSLLV